MKSPDVKCQVNTCTHWVTGNLCAAKNIDIMHEEEGHMAQIVDQTMCKTFSHASSVAQMLGSLDNMNWSGTILETALPGYHMKPTVACTVASCKFWGEGAICVANSIDVTGVGSNECQDTNCATFAKR